MYVWEQTECFETYGNINYNKYWHMGTSLYFVLAFGKYGIFPDIWEHLYV